MACTGNTNQDGLGGQDPQRQCGNESEDAPPRRGRESWSRYESIESGGVADAVGVPPPSTTLGNLRPCDAGTMLSWVRNLSPALLSGSGYHRGHRLLSMVRGQLHDATDFIADRNLCDDEAVAWAVWTVDAPNLYSRMCRLMREGDAASLEEYHTWLWWLMKGAEKLPDHNGVVYRAHQGKGGVMAYTPGAKVHYASFTACATRTTPQQLSTFGHNNGLLLALDVVGAKRLGPLSFYSDEDEVVLLPGWVGLVGRWFDSEQLADLSRTMNLQLTAFNVVEIHQDGLPTDRRLIAAEGERLHTQRAQENPNDSAFMLESLFYLVVDAIGGALWKEIEMQVILRVFPQRT